jgi:hypothetical protein
MLDGKLPNGINIENVNTDGFVEGSYAIAVHCLLSSGDYISTVKKAISFGGDTDTHAALAGSLAGIKYKSKSYKKHIYKTNEADEIINTFLDVVMNSKSKEINEAYNMELDRDIINLNLPEIDWTKPPTGYPENYLKDSIERRRKARERDEEAKE